MRLSVARFSDRSGTLGNLIRVALTIAMLVPIGTLYGMVRDSYVQRSQFATTERHGVAYTRALIAVELTLADSQTAALFGQPTSTERLTRAIDDVATIDVQHGGELRTRERWAELRAKIEALLSGKTADPEAHFEAYEETIDLLMTLLDKVRLTSGLIRDPYVDTYHLQDAAAQELPEAILRSSIMVSSAVLTSRLRPSEQAEELVSVLKLGDQVVSNTSDISDDLRQTVDSTESRTLGANLLPSLDRYRMAVDTCVPAATAKNGNTIAIDLATVGQTWKQMLGASAAFSTTLLEQLDDLLESRLDDTATDSAIAISLASFAALLALAWPVAAIARSRRAARTTRSGPGQRPRSPAGTAGSPSGRPDSPASRHGPRGDTQASGVCPAAPPAALPAGSEPAMASLHWERSGVSR
jgi:hypothetical protein